MNAMPDHASDAPGGLRLAGGDRLVLRDADVCYRVESGAVEVFLVRVRDGEPQGQRHFLCAAAAGDVVFGPPAADVGEWRFVAVGASEGRVRACDAASGLTPRNGMLPAVDRWVAALTAAVTGQPALTAKTETLVPDTATRYPAGTRLTAGDTVVWACLRDGGGTFLDDGNGFGPLRLERHVPVAGRAWIAVTEEARIDATDTAGLGARGLLPAALRDFHRCLVACLEARFEEAERQSRERLAEKARRNRAAVARALGMVASVLCGERYAAQLAVQNDDPLLAACRLVCKATRVPLPEADLRVAGAGPADRLQDLAATAGFRIRQVVLDGDWFVRDCGPLLVFRAGDGGPAAALPHGPRRYALYDPAAEGPVVLDGATAKALAPLGYMFYTPFPDRPLTGRDLLAFALRGQSSDFLMVLVIGLLAGLLGLLTPVMTQTVIDTVIPEADVGMLGQIGGIILVGTLAAAVFEIAKGLALLRVEGRTDAVLQSAVTDRLLGLPTAFFRQYAVGDLAMRCLGVNTINTILSGATVNALLAASFGALNLILLFAYDWRLALLANAFVLGNMLLVGLLGVRIVRKQRRFADLQGRRQGLEMEYLTGIAKLRLTGAESRAFGAWAEVFAKASSFDYQSGTIFNLIGAANAAFPTLASMALFHFFFHYRMEALNLGQFLAFYAAFAAFQTVMLQFVSVMSASLAVIPLYERARPILRAAPEVDAHKAKPRELRGSIEVSHVIFRYAPGGRRILTDCSIRVAPGEFVAVVGGSGSGKSTLLRLLLGFETPESGTVYYDGQDLRELDVREVRRHLGVVLQDDKPCAGTLFTNIAGVSNLTAEAAWEAARMVGLDADIEAMPMGMHTVVPAGGAGFSGGQIQRLLIARALVKRPAILFFDEATSALDNKTQAIVTRSLASLRVSRLVIAHRLSTITSADRIYVLCEGRIVESGSYPELMEKKEHFYALAKRQIA